MPNCGAVKWERNALGRPYIIATCDGPEGHPVDEIAGDGHWDSEQERGWFHMAPFPHDEEHHGTVTRRDDPAHVLLTSGHVSVSKVHKDGCYICEDPEFSAMGLPLCQPCPVCTEKNENDGGHIPADDEECDYCDYNAYEAWEAKQDDSAT